MPVYRVPFTASVVVQAKVYGQDVFNVLNFIKGVDTAWTALELYSLAQTVGDGYGGYLMPQISQSYIMGNVVATDISVDGGNQAIYTAQVGTTGGIATASLPTNVAFCIKFATGHVGRSYRGRIFIGGIPSSVVAADMVNGTWADNTVAALVSINNDASVLDYQQVVVSRFQDGLKLNPPETRVITTITYVDLAVDSMRRRLVGRGT